MTLEQQSSILQKLQADLEYDEHSGLITRKRSKHTHKKGSIAGHLTSNGYVYIKSNGITYPAHHLAVFFMTGTMPEYPKDEVDHKNRIRSDNRWSNLELGNRSDNQRNSGIRNDNTSGVKGVSWHKGKHCWVARISNNGRINLGSFDKFSDAVDARMNAEILYNYKGN